MKLRIWLGRIIPLVVIVIGEVRLYYVLFNWGRRYGFVLVLSTE